MRIIDIIRRLAPGVWLCVAVSLGAEALQQVEQRVFGRVWLEALVLAILAGTATRSAWTPGPRWGPGIAFSGKALLELAIVLLGASFGLREALAGGPVLLLGIGLVVPAALAISYGLGRLFGLSSRTATLVACGNSICGNSAIAAVAPVIGAAVEEVAAAIAFTAVLGVAVVVALPWLAAALDLTQRQFGVLAGLTVYAVPQVLAATARAGAASVQLGTVVKLVRVLTLGPVVAALSLGAGRGRGGFRGLRPGRLAPWFIVGFLALGAARTSGLIPSVVLAPAAWTAQLLTVVAMAALGLGVDIRALVKPGPRIAAAVVGSLVALGLISLAFIRLAGVA